MKEICNDNLLTAYLEDLKSKLKTCDDVMATATFMNREILVIDEITDELGDVVDSYIRFWNIVDNERNTPIEERTPIKIYIDSPGGSLTATFEMINSIELSKTPVYTITTGTAYSGGFFLAIAGHKRFAYPLASFLYHEGSVSNGGDAGKFRNFSKFYEVQLKQLEKVVLNKTKITEEEYERHIKDDWWMTADEALSYGVIDEIVKEFI